MPPPGHSIVNEKVHDDGAEEMLREWSHFFSQL